MNTTTIKNKIKWIILILLVFIGLLVWAFYNDIVISNYEITSDKISENESVRIVVIADLHSHIYGDQQKPLIEKIEAQDPDIIALVGDIVDDNKPTLGAELFLQGIQDIAPIYYVSGNHEYWSGDCDSIKEMISGYGITVLNNERVNIIANGIRLCICGIDDPEVFEHTDDEALLNMASEDEILERFSDIDYSIFNILLAHRPERIESYTWYDFDLVLSGHAHGGQVRIPFFLNGLYAPDQGFFPEYAGGLYKHDALTHIVSRGLSYNRNMPRIFNPPEVVVIDIKGE